jgi:DNA-binding SARP family transcriptional activator
VGLLAFLLLHANRSVSSDELHEALWPEQERAGALKRVHMAIARLRKSLEPLEHDRSLMAVLRTVSSGYVLTVAAGDLDAQLFEDGVREGRARIEAGDLEHAAQVLRAALALWRGPALMEVAYENFARAEIRHLDELRASAIESRIEADLGLGRHKALVSELRALSAEHPQSEPICRQLMLALYRCGRQIEALDAYQRLSRNLLAELGLHPGPALQSLQCAILEHADWLSVDAGAPAPSYISPRAGSQQAVRVSAAAQKRASGPRSTLRTAEHDALDQAPALATAGQRTARPARSPNGLARALSAVAGQLPFAGRERELASLKSSWAESSGVPAVVMISGEAGIGKTRAAAELAAIVHDEGSPVLYGRCDEGLGAPYQPFVEALRSLMKTVDADHVVRQLGGLAPELARLLPELAGVVSPASADPESARLALFEAVLALLELATSQQRVLLVLDDLHWAAPATLMLLRYALRSERRLDLLLVATYRSTELQRDHPLARLVADLQRDDGARFIALAGLDEPAIGTLLRAATAPTAADPPAQLVARVRIETAGNPFFVHELVADLLESDAFADADVGWSQAMSSPTLGTAEGPRDLAAPEGLRHVIGQRVARLSAPTVRTLSVAAAAGATFSFVVLEGVLGACSNVLDALDEAVAAGLLREAGNGDHAFAHALVRQTIYEQLGAARRMRLHRQLGEALEALADQDAHGEALAYHFAQAAGDGQGVKAAAYALAAGGSATARLGFEEAAAHYERGIRALGLTGQSQDKWRCELLLALGDAHWGSGELDKARQAYEQAAELAERLGDATALAHAALGYCGPHRFEKAPAVTGPVAERLQRALAALGDHDSTLRARLMGRLAVTLAFAEVEHRKPLLARQALQMARRIADKATLADVLASTQLASHGPDTLRESLAMTEELGRIADEIGDRRLHAVAHSRLLDFLLELGDIDGVERELEALQRLARPRGERYCSWLLAVFRANYAYLQGRLDECATLVRDVVAYRFEGYDEPAARILGVQQALYVPSEELVRTLENLAAHYPQIAAWRCLLAHMYVQFERTAQARQELEALAGADFCDLPRDVNWLPSLSALSEVVVFVGDVPRAHALHTLLSPYADRCVVIGALLCTGSVSRPLGLLATTLSRYEEAARHFERALRMNTQIRSPLWIATTQHDYAHMLLLRGGPGDRDKARELLTNALATADRLDLKPLADKARGLRLTAQAAGIATNASPRSNAGS